MTAERDGVYRLDVSGLLAKSEFDHWQAVLAREIDRIGAVRLLVVLDRFDGWDQRDNWSDLNFYATHGERIARIAIVGDERWRAEMMMFAIADLRKGPVEYFGEHAIADARSWLDDQPPKAS
jgi:hypothetical protein